MYNKLFSKIVTSSIWLEPTPTRMIWITFLALMDEDGFAPIASIANLAHTARIDLEEATTAVQILESPDENSGDKDNEGRRIEKVPGGWMVLNAVKYRDIVTRVVAREKTKERVRRFRERKVGNADVTPSNDSLRSVTPSYAVSESYAEAETEKPLSGATPQEWQFEGKIQPSSLVLHESLPKDAWSEWMEFRKEKGWSVNFRTLTKQLAELAKHPTETQRQMIDASINGGWQGIFPPKSTKSGSSVADKITYRPTE